MAQEQFGLFDTPPDRTEIRLGLAIVVLIFAVLLIVSPVRNLHVGVIPGLVPAVNAAMIVCDFITAAILYAQAAVFRSRALTALASGYLLGGFLLIPYGLTYPGAFAPNGLLDAGVNTTAWIGTAWRVSTTSAIIVYAWLKRTDRAIQPPTERPAASVLYGALWSAAIAVAVTLVTTLGHDWLPSYFRDRNEVIAGTLDFTSALAISLTLAAMVMLARQKLSVLDMWLLVALSAWLGEAVLNIFLYSRFSVGALAVFGGVFASNLVVMLALMTESNRLYAKLALSLSAHNRERDARLLSMDAMAATIDHELKQPLGAIIVNGGAALSWLEHDPPNRDMVAQSVQTTIEEGRRACDLITSIRSMATRRTGKRTSFSLNDLIGETVVLLDRELVLGKISLELALDKALPSISADRIQMQQVLSNLLINSVQSLTEMRGRQRRITISATTEGPNLMVRVSDNGMGVPAEKMERIFDFFFTTKATGTGIGLSLCRMIVEEHGGRLWASPGVQQGATFHLELPRIELTP